MYHNLERLALVKRGQRRKVAGASVSLDVSGNRYPPGQSAEIPWWPREKHVQGGAVGHEKFRGKRAAQPYARQRQVSTQTATAADLVIADFERG